MPRETIKFENLSRKKHLFYLLSYGIGLLGIILVEPSFFHENIWRKDSLHFYPGKREGKGSQPGNAIMNICN
jgi:hypothetical protein